MLSTRGMGQVFDRGRYKLRRAIGQCTYGKGHSCRPKEVRRRTKRTIRTSIRPPLQGQEALCFGVEQTRFVADGKAKRAQPMRCYELAKAQDRAACVKISEGALVNPHVPTIANVVAVVMPNPKRLDIASAELRRRFGISSHMAPTVRQDATERWAPELRYQCNRRRPVAPPAVHTKVGRNNNIACIVRHMRPALCQTSVLEARPNRNGWLGQQSCLANHVHQTWNPLLPRESGGTVSE